ncbi:hypothetical protein THOM_1821 [Trachipleistophora hominis]|uniref:Uncharacterized protein n=1 Tax=Trachipleistophora hominis TaxID=72359 RepID=L7JUR4_TRAHO|nr:hypothetical protein THOM_1821 [Trachipleistophora hominis]
MIKRGAKKETNLCLHAYSMRFVEDKPEENVKMHANERSLLIYF